MTHFPYVIDLMLFFIDTIKATKLSAVAMREATSDVVEVRLVTGHNGLQVLQNQKALSFTEQSWMDLNGETVIDMMKSLTTSCNNIFMTKPTFYITKKFAYTCSYSIN